MCDQPNRSGFVHSQRDDLVCLRKKKSMLLENEKKKRKYFALEAKRMVPGQTD